MFNEPSRGNTCPHAHGFGGFATIRYATPRTAASGVPLGRSLDGVTISPYGPCWPGFALVRESYL